MAATSSFTEGASVFGGQANLLQAITTIFTVYDPDVIAVHTTCLSETIGDDIPQIIDKAQRRGENSRRQIRLPRQHAQLRGLARDRVREHGQGHGRSISPNRPKPKQKTINLIPGWVEPSDMREMKRLARPMGCRHDLLPRHVRRARCPANRQARVLSQGGSHDGRPRPHRGQPGHHRPGPQHLASRRPKQLENKCKVPFELLELPIGLRATDRFIETLRRLTRSAGAGGHHRGARPAVGYDHRHAPILLRHARGDVGRSRSTGVAGRVPHGSRHAAGLYGHRHARQAVRPADGGRAATAACPRPSFAKGPAPTCS